MLTIHVPPDVRQAIEAACRKSGLNETGGMLFGEHVAEDRFRVAEITVAGAGSFARFVRSLRGSLARLEKFFQRTQHDYQRFNYLGEWHSHPSFALQPSTRDDATMFDIVNDLETNARFAVAIIVKLQDGQLKARAFSYFPPDEREDADLYFESA